MCGWLPLVCPEYGTWPATQACALTGNRTSNTLVCRPALNPVSYWTDFKWSRKKEVALGQMCYMCFFFLTAHLPLPKTSMKAFGPCQRSLKFGSIQNIHT